MSDDIVFEAGTPLRGPIAKNLSARAKTVAAIFCTSNHLIHETVDWHLGHGFDQILLFVTQPYQRVYNPLVTHIRLSEIDYPPIPSLLNEVVAGAAGKWLYWGFNAEFLFYPHVATRSVKELIEFVTSEHLEHVYGFVLDAYAKDINRHPSGVCRENCCIDENNYYRLPLVLDEEFANDPLEIARRFSVHGGLRWRFSQYLPKGLDRLDRPALFLAREGLVFDADFTPSNRDLQTAHARNHSSVSLAIISFDIAQRLLDDPISAEKIDGFYWSGSIDFDWQGQSLLYRGYILPGQWF